MTPAERSAKARMAAYVLHSKVDSKAHMARARSGLDARFLRLVDPNNELDPEERRRRADSLRRAEAIKNAYKSHEARRRKNGTR